MSDEKPSQGGVDRRRILIDRDAALQDWATRFGVTREQLREAVERVGDRADEVERFLRGLRG